MNTESFQRHNQGIPMSKFNGDDYNPTRDDSRLSRQHEVIKRLMLDGIWRTLAEIEGMTGYPQSSISAQLRHLRKPKFGSYLVERKHRGAPGGGLYEYRVLPPVFDEAGQGAFFLGVQ